MPSVSTFARVKSTLVELVRRRCQRGILLILIDHYTREVPALGLEELWQRAGVGYR